MGKRYDPKSLLGKRFGKLTITKVFVSTYGDRKPTFVEFVCDCGTTGSRVFISTRLKFCSRTCPLLKEKCVNSNWTGYEGISGAFFDNVRQSARNRKHEFAITIQYLWDLFLKQEKRCAYTKIPLVFSSRFKKRDGNVSLDRIDSQKGYVPGNVQWVLKDINWMKQDFSHEEFLHYCNLIAENFKKQP